jgi:hypothetical protein
MCGDQDDRYLRLMLQNVGDYLETGNVSQEEIDDTKTKAPSSHLGHS